MNRRRFIYMLSGAAAVPLASGCTMLDALDDDRVVIEIDDAGTFTPGGIEVRVGETVIWRNRDTRPHSVSIDASQFPEGIPISRPEGVQPFTSGEILPNERFTHTFDLPGDYVYGCTLHPDSSMIGTIRVVE